MHPEDVPFTLAHHPPRPSTPGLFRAQLSDAPPAVGGSKKSFWRRVTPSPLQESLERGSSRRPRLKKEFLEASDAVAASKKSRAAFITPSPPQERVFESA